MIGSEVGGKYQNMNLSAHTARLYSRQPMPSGVGRPVPGAGNRSAKGPGSAKSRTVAQPHAAEENQVAEDEAAEQAFQAERTQQEGEDDDQRVGAGEQQHDGLVALHAGEQDGEIHTAHMMTKPASISSR